jgi:transposase
MDEASDRAMHQHRHEGDEYRRIELITGTSRRRRWSAEAKAAIVAESLRPDVNVSALARRVGVNRGLLQTWRREAMRGAAITGEAFVPIRLLKEAPAVEALPELDRSMAADVVKPANGPAAGGTVEIEGAGLRVRFAGALDIEALRAVLAHVGRRS